MRLLADENCDRLLVATLRDAGHDVLYVAETASGETDTDLMELARHEGRTILTGDRDFGLLAEHAPEISPAVILLRLGPLSRTARVRRVVETLTSLGGGLRQELMVIEPAQVRRRPYRRNL